MKLYNWNKNQVSIYMDQQELREKQLTNQFAVPRGILLIIGGAEKKNPAGEKQHADEPAAGSPILETFMKLIPSDQPLIELVTTAGAEDVEDTFKVYQKVFMSYGACRVNHIHHYKRENIDEQEIANRFSKADGVFFTGGDQLKLTSVYGGTNMITLLRNRYLNEPLVIAGTSAGAMALSTPMIFDGSGLDEMIAAGVKTTIGFEFLRNVCIDTHFSQRGRYVRLAQVIAANPSTMGIGIDEDTAVILKNGFQATVAGSGTVITIDGKNCRDNNITDFSDCPAVNIRNLKTDILSAGYEFEITQLSSEFLLNLK